MPTIYESSTKTRRMEVVREDIDAGPSFGKMEICTAGYAAVLATVLLNDPCGVTASGVLLFSGFPKVVTAALSGVAALVRFTDSEDNVVASGMTVGTVGSDADIIIDSVSITANNRIAVNSASMTHAI